MFEVTSKTCEKPVLVVRTATAEELSTYEKRKLANIEDNAQENKIEVINLNNQRLQINKEEKSVDINLGELAFKDNITLEDFAFENGLFIRCELDEQGGN